MQGLQRGLVTVGRLGRVVERDAIRAMGQRGRDTHNRRPTTGLPADGHSTSGPDRFALAGMPPAVERERARVLRSRAGTDPEPEALCCSTRTAVCSPPRPRRQFPQTRSTYAAVYRAFGVFLGPDATPDDVTAEAVRA